MIYRILCVLRGHKINTAWGLSVFHDDTGRHRFEIRACARCGRVFIERYFAEPN